LRHGSPAPESDEWESLASKLFSDGVIAIVITIMVLELKAPHRPSLEALQPVLPALLTRKALTRLSSALSGASHREHCSLHLSWFLATRI
jgi:hypothetical protein